MIRSEKEYLKAQKKMLLRVQSSNLEDIDPHQMSMEDAEILMSCIRSGYLAGRYKENGFELRTMDGKAHPELLSTRITPAGAAFLKPNRTDRKATWALIIAFLSLVVSILSSFLDIRETICYLIHLLKS